MNLSNFKVHRFPGAVFKSFNNKIDADNFLESHNENNLKRKRAESEEEGPKKKKIKLSVNTIHVFTDGGCSDNGMLSARAGIGIFFGENDSRNVSKRIIGLQTNNRAELFAIIETLRICFDYQTTLVINTDSEYAIKGIAGINKIKKNIDLFKEISEMMKNRKGKTKFKKVSGHTGMKDGNYHADLLATKSINN